MLVRFDPDASSSARERALTSRGARQVGTVAGTGYVKARTTAPAADTARALRSDPAVADVSLDYRRQVTATPNDPGYTYGYQDYLKTLRLPQAWDRTKGSTSQVIAVVDTGVDTTHPDLKGRTVPGYNVIDPGTAPTDVYGHGTMVAGIAAAGTNNGIGVAGAAWTGRVMPVKVLGDDGFGYDSDIAEGITWAAGHGAKTINLSLGGSEDNPAVHSAIKNATAKGAVVVAAAGNNGDDTPMYPAAYPEVLAVGATDWSGSLTDFSTWGDWVDVAAPGFDITSTYPGAQYATGSGTSFAAPLTSGVVALTRSLYPSLTASQVVSRIKRTARDAGPRGIDPYYGYGVVDAFYAVGGTWGTEFPQRSLGSGEPNHAAADAVALSTSATGTIGMEGDVDWYRFESTGPTTANITVTPAAYSEARAQNFDPMLEVYDADLRLLTEVDQWYPGDPESIKLPIGTGAHYIAIRNYNGAADTRAYTVSLATAVSAGGATPPGEQLWLRDVAPADFATGVAQSAKPTLVFQRALDPASVTTSTVRLKHGRTAATVPTTPTYEEAAKTVTLTPGTPLQDNTPYRIVVDGVRDQSGATLTERLSSTFRTVDVAPPAVGGFKAVGGVGDATLSWSLPNITDLDKVIVRMAAGSTAPSSVTAGTGVYAGTGTSKTVTGLTAGKTYSFRVWVKDRSGKYSTTTSRRLVGTALSVGSSTTSVTYGNTVTVKSRVTRTDTGAGIAGAPVKLYGRRKGSTTWQYLGTATSSSTGYLSLSHKPTWSLDYRWTYRNSTSFMGSRSSLRSVGVRPVVTATLSKTSFALGGSVTLSGSVSPSHAGKTVYLQRYVSGGWKTVTSRSLSSTSTYSFTIKPSYRGTYYYRVYRPADTDHLAATSSSRSFKVY